MWRGRQQLGCKFSMGLTSSCFLVYKIRGLALTFKQKSLCLLINLHRAGDATLS